MSPEAQAASATPPSIDDLLAHYLGLLDEYTRLRTALSARQVSLYSNLARANFSAERGMRYGPDQFDQRMQALARLEVTPVGPAGVGETNATYNFPSFALLRAGKTTEAQKTETDDKEAREPTDTPPEAKETQEVKQPRDDGPQEARPKKKDDKQAPKIKDPLKWFGVLTPMALRQAQQDAINAVDELIPRLASLDAEMTTVEIEVRRARKKRARAEAALEKEKQHKETLPEPATTSTDTAVAV